MSFLMTLADLSTATSGQLINASGKLSAELLEQTFNNLATDTRKVRSGDVFLALSGEYFDGHDFCQQAIDSGAIAVVVERELALEPSVVQFVVGSCHLALGQVAKYNRNQYQGPLIAVTGSNGKTTTKEIIAAILSVKGPTLATKGNLNNEIGVPLTLLEFNREHRYSIVEMGANASGEIAYCTALAQPDVAIITNAMAAHLQGFGSLQGVVAAKGEIFQGLKEAGVAILNLDDQNVAQWQAMLGTKKILTFSLHNTQADVYATDLKQLPAGNYQFTLNYRAASAELISKSVKLQLLAIHNVANALAAAASVFAIGASVEEVVTGLENAAAINGRLKALGGLNRSTIIDDSYNGNPDSVKAGLDFLAQLTGRKILALGDMAELGADEQQLHKSVGAYAAQKNIDYLFSCGPLGALAATEFSHLKAKPVNAFNSQQEMINQLKTMMNSETKVLVKGSLSAAMKKVVTELTPEVLR